MSEAAGGLRGIVVCHGPLARALVDATEQITGITGALVPVSNLGCGRDDLEARVQEAAGAEPAVVFVDMASGSCMFAVLRRLRQRPDIGIVRIRSVATNQAGATVQLSEPALVVPRRAQP